MQFSYDFFGSLERPQLILCYASKERIGQIDENRLAAQIKWNNMSEFSFEVPSVMLSDSGESLPSELYELVKEYMYIEIPNFGYYVLRDVQELNDGFKKYKQCVAYSAEIEFTGKHVVELEGQWRLWNPINPIDSILGVLLRHCPGWRIGSVDSALLSRWRSLSMTNVNLYALLKQLSEIYECLFIFNNRDFSIDVVDITRTFRHTSIYMSYDNLVKNSTIKTLTDGIITALHVRGGDGVSISGVNPNGTDTIYNVDYFKPRMSAGLLAALNAYEALFNSLQSQYANLLTQLRNQNGQMSLLHNNTPTYNVTFNVAVDGTVQITPALNNSSGLSQLEGLHRTLNGIKAARIEHNNTRYTDVNNLMNQVTPMINARRTAIANLDAQIQSTINQLNNITGQLRMENHFTEAQWIELNRYFVFDTFQEDAFIFTDLTTAQERQDIQQELFDMGARVLHRASVPAFEITMSSVNFFALPEFTEFTNQCELGTTFTLDMDGYVVRPLLLEAHVDFDDPTNFNLVFANKHTLDNDFSLVDFNSGAINATNSISFNLTRINAMSRQHDDVTAFINGALNASVNELWSSPSRTAITIDDTGLRARSYNWNTGLPTGREAWFTGSQLAFSDDGFTNSRLALGTVQAPGGGTAYGLVGDVLVGRILAGNELTIANENNNFVLDHNGARLNDASFTVGRTVAGVRREIVIDATNGLTFRNGANEVVRLNIVDGSANFAGTINGGSININNQFIVDPEGNVTIRRGSININNGAFTVDALGNMSMTRGSISIGGGQFRVDSSGNVDAHFIRIHGGRFQIGNTLVDESHFRTDNGDMCAFRRSLMDESCEYLGPITGTQITANSIAADRIVANSIGAGQIIANEVAAAVVATGLLITNRIQAANQANTFLTLHDGTNSDLSWTVRGVRLFEITDIPDGRLSMRHRGVPFVEVLNNVVHIPNLSIAGQDAATRPWVESITGNLATQSTVNTMQNTINLLQTEINHLWNAQCNGSCCSC